VRALAIAALLLVSSSAGSETQVQLRCDPVVVNHESCYDRMGEPFHHRPNRCRIS
jgi:hypothetical protein